MNGDASLNLLRVLTNLSSDETKSDMVGRMLQQLSFIQKVVFCWGYFNGRVCC